MKKCPFCKADIEEGARFCLYCMELFEEKQVIETPKKANKRWLYIIAAVLVFAVITVCAVLLFGGKDNPPDSSGNANSTSQTSTEDNNIAGNTDGTVSESGQSGSDSSGSESPPPTAGNENGNTSGNTPEGNTGSTGNTGGTTPSTPPSGSNTDTDTDTDTTTPPPSNPSQSKATYSYIEATIENAYPTGHGSIYPPENAIVITKVTSADSDGVYVIPETIDGKKVAAIMPGAFSDAGICETVKSVTLPATVRTIWSNAFEGCNSLSDIYLKSTVIGIYIDAFPHISARKSTLTIHCNRDCHDFDFYYYRNIADRYSAIYEEWNG